MPGQRLFTANDKEAIVIGYRSKKTHRFFSSFTFEAASENAQAGSRLSVATSDKDVHCQKMLLTILYKG